MLVLDVYELSMLKTWQKRKKKVKNHLLSQLFQRTNLLQLRDAVGVKAVDDTTLEVKLAKQHHISLT